MLTNNAPNIVCLAAAIALVLLLSAFNGKLEPNWSGNIQLGTVLIAIMSVYRLALKAIVETCVSQGAWIWVSGFRKGKTEAKLEDFKMFDEASRGLYGALVLLWRMRASHFACVGSLITILIQGFETFSSQMVTYTEIPTVLDGKAGLDTHPAPAPPRSESWQNIASNSFSETSLMLSTKAAVYNGIIASAAVPDIPVHCETANCRWPVFPSLAVCGACTGSLFSTSCDSQKGCSYSMPSGTSIYNQPGAPFEYHFTVAPSNGSSTFPSESSKAIISIFDIMSSAKTPRDNTVQAYQCGLWFCLRSYNVTVTNGVVDRSVTVELSKSDFAPKNSAHYDEYFFLDIPPEMNAKQHTRYSIPSDSLRTLRAFMDKLTLGNASQVTGDVTYDTDWIQAMDTAAKDLSSLSSWISRLALSLTTDIQLTGTVRRPNRDSEYSGKAYIMAPRVEVHWYWVAYPVTLMIFAFVYLMQTVWRTAQDRVCAWKTDSLPMLFCHVSKTIHAQVRDGMDAPEGLNYRVGRTEVELVRKDNGEWIFTEPRYH
ncbi:hypothetical protein E0Z10_g1145 [Xylaria hypoxylon]|uniref:Uncharacterized protein n=1 Tax=Xylaria hypoxylon TaxID=37992 RepID=A0A4Z0Z7Z0_9PEZI|nr:hypothetical protein E0Z10_g1145 [Xylaria hypoxylon]